MNMVSCSRRKEKKKDRKKIKDAGFDMIQRLIVKNSQIKIKVGDAKMQMTVTTRLRSRKYWKTVEKLSIVGHRIQNVERFASLE